MNTWTKAILIGTGAALLAFFLPGNLMPKKRNGEMPANLVFFEAHYLLRVTPSNNDNLAGIMSISANNISSRLNAARYKTKVTIKDKDELDIHITDITEADTSLIDKLFTGHSKVEFREMYNCNEIVRGILKAGMVVSKYLPTPPKPVVRKIETNENGPSSALKKFVPDETAEVIDDTARKRIAALIEFTFSPNSSSSSRRRFPATIGYVDPKDTALVSQILGDSAVMNSLPLGLKFYYGVAEEFSGKDKKFVGLYAIHTYDDGHSYLSNEDILKASTSFSYDSRPEVEIEFNVPGTRKWAKMTSANVDKPLAIIYNGQVVSAPFVESAIDGGKAVISGGFSFEQTKMIAAQLTSISVPASYTILEKHISKPGWRNIYKDLLRALIVFIVAMGVSVVIFKMLKNS